MKLKAVSGTVSEASQDLTRGSWREMLPAMSKKMSWFSFAVVAARALLQYRETRRKIIFYTIIALLVVFAAGNWPLSSWLEDSPLRFLFYWSGCVFLAMFLFLLGLYDALRVLKEFRDVKKSLRIGDRD